MKIRFFLIMTPPNKVAVVLRDYQHYLQGAFWRPLTEEQPVLDGPLHKDRLKARTRGYRMLTFAKLFPPLAKAGQRGLILYPNLHWLVSTARNTVAKALERAVLGRGQIHVHRQPFLIQYIK